MGSWPGWCPAVLAPPPIRCPSASRVTPGGRSAGSCSRTARNGPGPPSTHLLQSPPDLGLLVQLGLQHLLLLAGQLHLLFNAFLLLYFLKVTSKAIPSPGNRPPSPSEEGKLGSSQHHACSVCDLGPQTYQVASPLPTKSADTWFQENREKQ